MPVLDSQFWTRFAKTAWEKKSIAVKNIQSPLLQIDEKVIFDLLVAYGARCRKLKSADGMKFYIEGHRQFESEVLRHLPKKSDVDFLGYHERMSSQYDDYCLVCDELLQMDNEQQEHLEEFTSQLFSSVGLPNRFAEMGLYLGNYKKTPFGVHEDPCGVFSFPVVGKKKFRIWEPDYVSKNPALVRAFSYPKHKAASQLLEANVGDMTYWPSSAWHIAESDGSFSATWSLGVWVDRKQSEVVTDIMNELIQRILGVTGTTGLSNVSEVIAGEVESLPATYRESLSKLNALTSATIESAFRESWMRHLSKNGLKTHPESKLDLKQNVLIRLKSVRRPVLWMRDGLNIVYAFNGEALRTSSKPIFRFVKALNEGESVRVPREALSLQPLARAGAFALADETASMKSSRVKRK